MARQLINFIISRSRERLGDKLFSEVKIVGLKIDLDPLFVRLGEIGGDRLNLGLLVAHEGTISDVVSELKLTVAGNTNPSAFYLSPDSDTTLPVHNRTTPEILIIGGIVDRNIQLGRSSKHAEKNGITSASLPLSMAGLEGLLDNEPLNVDSVLEMMDVWHERNFEYKGEEKEAERGRLFVESAVEAMLIHEERHPNRTLHLED